MLRGYSANQASNFARSKYAKLVKTQEQRLKMNQAVKRAKDAVKRAGGAVRNAGVRAGTAAAGAGILAGAGAYRGIRAPNRGVRRGFFGGMQGVQQYRANKQRTDRLHTLSKNAYTKIQKAKTERNARIAQAEAAFKAQEQKIRLQLAATTERAEAANAMAAKKKNVLAKKASFWGGLKGGVRF